MKRTLLILAVIACSISYLSSQDIIIKNNNEEIKSKIIEITSENIKYRSFNQPEGPIRNISVNDVLMIIYEDGTRELIPSVGSGLNSNIGHHHILYSSVVPWAPFGLKYMYRWSKLGGYVSVATDFFAIDGVVYLTGGFMYNISPTADIYLGGGLGPELLGGYEYFDSPLVETGIVLSFNNIIFDIGGGINTFDLDYSYGRIGFGIKF